MELHFLRPWWFLGLIPVVWLVWKAWHIKTQQGAWQNVIEPKFRTLLLGDQANNQPLNSARLAVIGLASLWLMAIIALAGPSLKSVELPAEKTHQGNVIILDLSLSMLADDLKPNRVSRARFKLIDLLKAHPEQAFGLVGYAGSAHTIAPISEDNQTLLTLIPSLNPLIMPQYGSEPLLAMQQAEELLKGAKVTQGHLIWITDDLETSQREAIEAWLVSTDYSLSILAVGTPEGGTVTLPNYGLLKDDNGAIVLPKLPYSELETLSQNTGAALTPLTINDSDLQRLLPSNLGAIAQQKAQSANQNEEKQVLHPLDDGTAVILAMLPLLALAFRRGWLFSLAMIGLLPLGGLYAPPSYAEAKFSDFADVFQTPDQQAYKAWEKQDYNAAEALFESPQWKGSALYRNGKYKEAAQQFKQDQTPQGFYNLGNALAKQGQLEEAKQAYEEALKKQPDLEDARNNLQLINDLLDRQQQSAEESMQSQSKNQTPSESASQDQKNGQTSESEPSEKSENSEQSNADSENRQGDQAETDDSESDQASNENAKTESEAEQQANGEEEPKTPQSEDSDDTSEADSKQTDSLDDQDSNGQSTYSESDTPPSEQEQATKNWLKQIPDQPGLFLKRKFEYQFQNQSPSSPRADSETEQATKKIW